MARTRVADFKCDLGDAPGGFADELLSANDTLSLDELQWGRCQPIPRHSNSAEILPLSFVQGDMTYLKVCGGA
jgi:hypothetical protein